MKIKGRVPPIVIGVLMTCCSPSSGVAISQPEVTCPVSVYVFIDISTSLDRTQLDNLREGLEGLLSAGNSPFPNEAKVYLVPFAGKVDSDSLKAHIADIGQLGRSFDEVTSWVNRKKMAHLHPDKTDLREVLGKILEIGKGKLLPQDQDPDPYTVFIIASDFVHDPENEPAHLEANLRSWQDFFDKDQRSFHELFSAGVNRALLLLNSRLDINSVSLGVLTDLTEAGSREKKRAQVGSFSLVGSNPFDNALFTSYLKPLDVTVERRGSVGAGGAQLEIKVHNRSCLHIGKLGPLQYSLNVRLRGSNRYLMRGDLLEKKASRDWIATVAVKKENVEPRNITADEIDDPSAAYVAEVVVPAKNSNQPSVLGSTSTATKDSLFISAFRGTLEDRLFHADLQMQGNLSDVDHVVLQLSLLSQQGGAVAEKDLPVRREEVSRGVKSFLFEMPYNEMENICYHSDYRPALRILSKAPGVLEEEQEGKIFELEPDGRSDGDHLLQEIFEQASLPAAITAVLTLLLVWRRFDEIEKVEKVLAVVALIATTVVVLLHRLTRTEESLDGLMLSPWKVRMTAIVTLFFMFLMIFELIRRGGLPLARTDEALLADISFSEAHRKRWGEEPKVSPAFKWVTRIVNPWARLVVLMLLVAGATVAISLIWIDTQRKMSCAFGFIQYPSSDAKH